MVATYDYTYNGTAGKNPNITSITQGTTVKNFSYDHQNRLVGFIQTVNGPSTIDESYLYPTHGERLAKINNKSGTNNEEWEFALGDNPAVYYTKSTGGSYTLDSEMVPGNGIDDRWARIKADGTDLFYIPDPLGGAHRVINGSQAILNTVMTTAWGLKHPTFTETNTQPDPFGFAGMRKDGGSLHCRARAYLPEIGRFAQPDPIGFAGGDSNLYAYVGNRPSSHIDPFGLDDLPKTGEPLPAFVRQNQATLKANEEQLKTQLADQFPTRPQRKSRDEVIADLQKAGFEVTQRPHGEWYYTIPGGFIDLGSPEAWAIVKKELPEILTIVSGFNFQDPSLLDVLSVLPVGKLIKIASVLRKAETATNGIRMVARTERQIQGVKSAEQFIAKAGSETKSIASAEQAAARAKGIQNVENGVTAEVKVSEKVGAPRNTGGNGVKRVEIPGSGPGGFRIPDFDPAVTIKLRGTIVEVKNVKNLSMTPQLKDLIAEAERHNVKLEIFTNAPAPTKGELYKAMKRGSVILSPID